MPQSSRFRNSTVKQFPLGVSGLLRCRNSADFLELCVKSCIDALDELIAVWYDSTDGTPEILKRLQEQFPDKIRVFHYDKYIFPIDLSEGIYTFAAYQNQNSPYLFHTLANFALSKARFRYVLKIDTDHIFFPHMLQQICNAYRENKKSEFTQNELHAGELFRNGQLTYNDGDYYLSYVNKRITNEKLPVAFSGINLCHPENEWMVCLGSADNDSFFPMFNGLGDHFFFENTKQTLFERMLSPNHPSGHNRIIDRLPLSRPFLYGGFLWFHVHQLTNINLVAEQHRFKQHPERFAPISDLRNLSFSDFSAHYSPYHPIPSVGRAHYQLFDVFRPLIEWEMLEKIKSKFISNIQNMEDNYNPQFTEEFYRETNRIISDYITHYKVHLSFAGIDLSEAIGLQLKTHLVTEADHFVRSRVKGLNINEALNRVRECMEIFTALSDMQDLSWLDNDEIAKKEHPWVQSLADYTGASLVCIARIEQVNWVRNLYVDTDIPVILFTAFDVPNDTELPDNFVVLQRQKSPVRYAGNKFMEYNFPYVFYIADTFCWLLQLIQPSDIIIDPKGNTVAECVMGVIARNYYSFPK